MATHTDLENIFHVVFISLHISYTLCFKAVTGKLSTLVHNTSNVNRRSDSRPWSEHLPPGENKRRHFKRDPTHSQQALCSSSQPNLIYLLWRTRWSASRDQSCHGNSLIRRTGAWPGQQKSGVLLGLIGLHKWLRPWKGLASLHLRHLPFLSAGMQSAPPSASGQMTGLYELDMSHLTDNNALD